MLYTYFVGSIIVIATILTNNIATKPVTKNTVLKEEKKIISAPEKTQPLGDLKSATTKTETTEKTASTHNSLHNTQKHEIVDEKKEKKVTIRNTIQDAMLAYNYCFISYSPTSFSMYINGKPLEKKESISLPIQQNKITVRYEYAFLGGKRKGAKEIEFELDPKLDSFDISFSWSHDDRIVIPNAKSVSVTKIY